MVICRWSFTSGACSSSAVLKSAVPRMSEPATSQSLTMKDMSWLPLTRIKSKSSSHKGLSVLLMTCSSKRRAFSHGSGGRGEKADCCWRPPPHPRLSLLRNILVQDDGSVGVRLCTDAPVGLSHAVGADNLEADQPLARRLAHPCMRKGQMVWGWVGGR